MYFISAAVILLASLPLIDHVSHCYSWDLNPTRCGRCIEDQYSGHAKGSHPPPLLPGIFCVNAVNVRVVLDGQYFCLIFGKKPPRLLLGISRSPRVKITLIITPNLLNYCVIIIVDTKFKQRGGRGGAHNTKRLTAYGPRTAVWKLLVYTFWTRPVRS